MGWFMALVAGLVLSFVFDDKSAVTKKDKVVHSAIICIFVLFFYSLFVTSWLIIAAGVVVWFFYFALASFLFSQQKNFWQNFFISLFIMMILIPSMTLVVQIFL